MKVSYIETIASTSAKEQAVTKFTDVGTVAVEIPAATSALLATKLYRLGVGDVITIDVQNYSRDYVVRSDGSIDFPLIDENLMVAGETLETLRTRIESQMRLYVKPRISVVIRDQASHSVLVTGLVDAPGNHQIQRDAVPLFVIRAVAMVSSRATEVKVTRSQGKSVEMYLLANNSNENILIFPGDEVEFTGK